jgi:hypothetical protein
MQIKRPVNLKQGLQAAFFFQRSDFSLKAMEHWLEIPKPVHACACAQGSNRRTLRSATCLMRST